MEKIFYIDEVRVWFNQVQQKQISFSKFVELLNEKATNPKETEAVHGNEAEKGVCPQCGNTELSQSAVSIYCDNCGFVL